ncbi:unnamed protein product [Sphagnum jensenii]|uniref:Uncharacterized protein n=1 Tax=Sphagnum jensenii TaxID=128206 RepID=A0ABP0XJ57_9BRYO
MDPHQRCVGKSIFLMSGRRRLNCVQKCHQSPLYLSSFYCLAEHQAMTFGFGHFWQEISSRPIPLGNPNTGLEWKEKRTHHFHP